MTSEKRAELNRKLAANGLTILKTSDYESLTMHVARLARFHRLMITTAAGNPVVETAVDHVSKQMDDGIQPTRSGVRRPDPSARMAIEDIPCVLRVAHAGLCNYLDGNAALIDPASAPDLIDHALEIARSGRALDHLGYIRTGLINATVAALVGVISIDRQVAGEAA